MADRAGGLLHQLVHVVSIDDVPMMFGSASFQSNEVSAAAVYTMDV